ncbi:mRNA export factor Gle1 [Calliphora vicina]|uniref:mRNA export factor Gle1 n=1 Tax=Calliphora vicina TaxID=7373 RepID=UPI00325ADB82
MANFALKVEEIINEVNKIHLVTLQHAAEISPFVHDRSIGPDMELIDYKENELPKDRLKGENIELNKDLTKSDKNEINKKKTPCKEKQNSPHHNEEKLHREPNSLHSLDFQTINSSILLRDAEEKRKRSIRQQMIDMQEKHLNIMHQTLQPLEEKQQEERRKWLEKKRRSDSQILQKVEQQSVQDVKEHERQLESLRLQTQKQLQLISFQGISQYQSKFRHKYESIVHLLMSIDKQALMSCAEYNKKLKELIQMFEQLIGKIKSGECGPTELKTAENLCKSLEDLEISILEACKQEKTKLEEQQREQQQKEEELAKQEQAQQAQKVSEEQQQQQQQQLQEQQQQQQTQLTNPPQQISTETPKTQPPAQPPNTDSGSMGSSQFVSAERFEFYTKINTFYQEKVERVKVLQSDESMKKYRFDCQKNINIPVNAISAVSQQHIQDKFDKLFTFVTAQPTLGRDYCILLMAKKFVGQGETTISSNPQAAFPVASVIVSLWKHIPEFGQLFLAYVFKECPFLVPYFIPQKKGQTIEEYSKVLGYRITEGQIETQDMYLKRQTGVARLYAAVMITLGRQQDGPAHPYGIEHAWRWLTNFVALDPLPDICATLIMEILQIVGSDLWSAYGKQFVKLLFFIQQQYFPRLSAVDEGGPRARLELLLGNFLREGQIQKPQGILPPGFW